MRYKNEGYLQKWSENVDKVAELTRHSPTRVSSKKSLDGLFNSINVGKLLGAKWKKELNGKKYILTSNSKSNPTVAFIECLGSLTQLPVFLKMFYPEMLQRNDYREACRIVDKNLKQLPTKRSKCPDEVKDLFVPMSKSDSLRDDKKLLLDCWRAINYATVNQVAGSPLVKGAGRGVYLTCDVVKSMLKYPQNATPAKIYNGLLLLRVGGFIQLAQDDELTPAGLKLQTIDKNGVTVRKNNVFILNDFDQADPKLITDNLRLVLTTRVSKAIIEKILGSENTKKFFPLVNSGVDEVTIGRFQQAIKGKDLIPISTLSDAVNNLESVLGISAQLARLYINQLCQYKPLHVVKLRKTDAVAQGYDLTGLKDIHSSEKLLVIAKE
ncbi:hypothetical protein [Lacticaseibacillus paracasei]|uniref:hypothetical protein n=1 Tax=Lacticaseibacillus paracasei TaxID=1597 RepID=UPI00403F21FE